MEKGPFSFDGLTPQNIDSMKQVDLSTIYDKGNDLTYFERSVFFGFLVVGRILFAADPHTAFKCISLLLTLSILSLLINQFLF